MQLAVCNNYEKILLSGSALLDVRAPVEFEQGAFPTAANLPLLNDDERHQVGICYKEHGQQKAVEFGHQLLSGQLKQQRVDRWLQFARQHSETYLYCFRGGLRSKISQQWLHEAGIDMTRVHGGFKALRRFLIKQIENAPAQFEFILVGGLTGCRKTELIQTLPNGVDLEGAAYHRGSSFGGHALPQNSQINFENRISIDLLAAQKANQQILTVEDEGRFIGSVDIPKNLFVEMRKAPLVIVEQSLERRLQQLLREYVIDMLQEFTDLYSDEDNAFDQFSSYLLDSLFRIQKRLGRYRWADLHNSLQHSLQIQKSTGNTDQHLQWLTPLLTQYYDPMYTSQICKRKETVVFRGNFEACKQFLMHYASN